MTHGTIRSGGTRGRQIDASGRSAGDAPRRRAVAASAAPAVARLRRPSGASGASAAPSQDDAAAAAAAPGPFPNPVVYFDSLTQFRYQLFKKKIEY